MLKIEAPQLSDMPVIAHGFFGRKGGTSSGIYESLNCGPGSGDDGDHVAENRRRALGALADRKFQLVTLYQIHSGEGVTVKEPWEIGNAPKADAMATNVPGIALGILTADCAPVLLADGEAKVIGAAHAGWKGALAGVTDDVIARMERLGAKRERIAAVVGPCISQSAYEVGNELREAFVSHDAANTGFFVAGTRPGHWQFDLSAYVGERLKAAGISNPAHLARCTYGEAGTFFSFRRATHAGQSDYGRQLSAISLL